MVKITSVSFEYLVDGGSIATKVFFYDPDENATAAWLNEPDREFNVLLNELARKTDLASGAASISWDDGFRASLPIPIKGMEPGLTCIGDLLGLIATLMMNSEEFSGLEPSQNSVLLIAERAGRLPHRNAAG